MHYTDLHTHMLFGVDDGAKTEMDMCRMVDASYRDGTRTLCLTPHFQPTFYGDNRAAADFAFGRLKAYAAEHYPDLSLHLANELGYYTGCRLAIHEGECRFLGGAFLLMDFSPDATLFQIRYAMDELLSSGYRILLAHVERYPALHGEEDLILDWTRRGALLQVNASAFSRKASFAMRRRIKKLLHRVPVAAVASDAHDVLFRSPLLSEAEAFITAHYDADMAHFLLSYGPSKIVKGESPM